MILVSQSDRQLEFNVCDTYLSVECLHRSIFTDRSCIQSLLYKERAENVER